MEIIENIHYTSSKYDKNTQFMYLTDLLKHIYNTCNKVALASARICDVHMQYAQTQQEAECKQMQQLQTRPTRVLE